MEYDKIILKLIAARKEIQPIGKDASGRFKYASLPAIIATVQPVLLKHGLFLTQNEVVIDNDISVLETTIFESEGQFIRATARINNPLFKDEKMNGIQNHGSILTYLKRYAIANMMCLEIQEDDPDGFPVKSVHIVHNKPKSSSLGVKTITESQQTLLRTKLKFKPIEKEILEELDIERIEEIPMDSFNGILKKFNTGN